MPYAERGAVFRDGIPVTDMIRAWLDVSAHATALSRPLNWGTGFLQMPSEKAATSSKSPARLAFKLIE
ncbi:hypothetical protein [Cupriavidus consociatus]|uniref:hypothetical protein n=1 Tax=Cupriavidus consociatus TaxID=2821357 RepID=UPI001FD7FCC2|nr:MULTISPECIES: hypothetical protein [unclassified Cupriavidus]MDK2661545.1 hypothetical protein [Cupriavidus sp. LEh21]